MPSVYSQLLEYFGGRVRGAPSIYTLFEEKLQNLQAAGLYKKALVVVYLPPFKDAFTVDY